MVKDNQDYVEMNWRRFYCFFSTKSAELTLQIDKPWRMFHFGWTYLNYGWPELHIHLGFITLFFSWMRGFNNKFDENGDLK